jgi:hypothetical protein
MKNRSDTGRAFSAGYTPKLFWRDAGKWNPGTLQLTDEFSRERSSQQFFTVKQRLDGTSVINRCYEVADAFNEEKPMLVAIVAFALKFTNSSEGGSSVQLPIFGSIFIFHPP